MISKQFLHFISFPAKMHYENNKGGGGSGPKFSKQVFELTVDPQGPPSGPTFWSGLDS